jgi:kinesin family protein 20
MLVTHAPSSSHTFKNSAQYGKLERIHHKFTFSHIFDDKTSQKEFFDETVLSTVKEFIDGQNCLVFTYGVTNSGKTYTVQGMSQGYYV